MRSPNKYTSLKNLKNLAANNYVSVYGTEYVQGEVDRLIIEKSTRQAQDDVKQQLALKEIERKTRRANLSKFVTPAMHERAGAVMKGLK